MSEIDTAREHLKAALFDLDEQLRPQDAAAVVADLAYLTPAVGTLAQRIGDRLAAAERLPGLYSTSNPDARAELRAACAHLRAAQEAVDGLTQSLEAAQASLASLGHSDTADSPLKAVADLDEGEHLTRPGWQRTDVGRGPRTR